MACKLNEVTILKAQSVKLDNDTALLLTYMYHTAEKEARKAGTDKSFYRYEGRIAKISDLKTEIHDLMQDAVALKPYAWPTKSKSWNPDWFLGYKGSQTTNKEAAKWLRRQVNKMISWSDFLDLAKNGVKKTAKGIKSYPSARYDLTDFELEDGTVLNLDVTDPAPLAKLAGKTFSKKVILKRELPTK